MGNLGIVDWNQQARNYRSWARRFQIHDSKIPVHHQHETRAGIVNGLDAFGTGSRSCGLLSRKAVANPAANILNFFADLAADLFSAGRSE